LAREKKELLKLLQLKNTTITTATKVILKISAATSGRHFFVPCYMLIGSSIVLLLLCEDSFGLSPNTSLSFTQMQVDIFKRLHHLSTITPHNVIKVLPHNIERLNLKS